jgi:hypothetical protein
MARRKKATVVEPVAEVKPVMPTIGYSGKVTVAVRAGKTVISKHTYKNNGGLALFKFLTACIAGEYRAAEVNRPLKIGLYDSDLPRPVDGDVPSITKSVSILISVNTDSTIESGADYSKVTLHFLIPKTYITSDNAVIKQMVLFPAQATSADPASPAGYCAVFNLTNDNDATE